MDDMTQKTSSAKPSFSPLWKVLGGAFLLFAVALSVYLVQQEQDIRQDAAFRKGKQTFRPRVTPPVLPTLAPVTKNEVYTMVSQIEYEVDNYLEQYQKDVRASQQVNPSLDNQAL